MSSRVRVGGRRNGQHSNALEISCNVVIVGNRSFKISKRFVTWDFKNSTLIESDSEFFNEFLPCKEITDEHA